MGKRDATCATHNGTTVGGTRKRKVSKRHRPENKTQRKKYLKKRSFKKMRHKSSKYKMRGGWGKSSSLITDIIIPNYTE